MDARMCGLPGMSLTACSTSLPLSDAQSHNGGGFGRLGGLRGSGGFLPRLGCGRRCGGLLCANGGQRFAGFGRGRGGLVYNLSRIAVSRRRFFSS
jgi:hypothetical protein